MDTPRTKSSRALILGAAAAIVLIVLATLFLLGGGDASDEAGSGTSSTLTSSSDDDSAIVASPSRASTTTAPAGGEIEGSWTADASDILTANTANVGGAGGLSCSGPITMTFTPEGAFQRSGRVTCRVGSTSASGAVASAGRYVVRGDQLVISGTEATGTISIGSTEVPAPDAFGDGTATYEVTGSTLTITFTDPSVGTVTQTYRRS